MNDTRKGIYAKLTGDATLTSIITGVHYGVAKENVLFPYVIFHKQTGNPRWTFNRQDGDTERFFIKGLALDTATQSGQEIAESINERIKVVLTDTSLTLTQNTLVYLRHERDVEYQEQRADGTVFIVGSIWRMETNR